MSPAANQLIDLVHERLNALGPLTGLDWFDHMPQIAARCELVVAELDQDDDDRLAAEACLTVMAVAWATGNPDEDDPEWWRSPLGKLCARSLGRTDAEAVTHAVAAAMLGLSRTTIGPMVARGDLDRHPDGGVLRASVLQRLSR